MLITPQQVEQAVLETVSFVTRQSITGLSRETRISDLHLGFMQVAQTFEQLELRIGQDLPWDDMDCSAFGKWQTIGEFADWVGRALTQHPEP